MVEGDPDGYQMFVWRDPSIELLRNVIQSDSPEAKGTAIELIHRLGAMGHLEYRDLLLGE